MAEPFQPKFVDLVRNFTFTAGTGNVVLDKPVPGFAGFADALQPGDRFYYTIAGIETPGETEVGRGTMEDDGTIARQPVSGVLVDFSNGRKTIALIAAAEWFQSIEALREPSQPTASVAELAALDPRGSAVLSEVRRAGLFVFDSGNLSARVAADQRQAVHVAPASDPSGNSGAWVRQHDGWLRPEWFGAAGDGVSNDQPAFDGINSLIAALGHASIRLRERATYLVGKQNAGESGWHASGKEGLYANGLSSFSLDMNGATLKHNAGLKFGRFDSSGSALPDYVGYACPASERASIGFLVRANNVQMVTIVNGTLDGNSANQLLGGKTGDDGWQIAHYGIYTSGCTHTYIENLVGFDFFLDAWNVVQAGLTATSAVRPYAMVNCNFYNVGRNVGTISGGNDILLLNCSHKHGGAPKPGGGILEMGPGSCLDIEATSIIRHVRIIGGRWEAGAGTANRVIITDSGDVRDVLIDSAEIVGSLWLNKPRCVLRNCKINGSFPALLGGQANPLDNVLVENCQMSDVTAHDTPQFNVAGSFLNGNARGSGVTVRNSSIHLAFSRLNLRGMVMSDVTVTVAFGTDVFADKGYFALCDAGAIMRRVTFVDAISANVPTEGFYIPSPATSLIEDCAIISTAGRLKWNSWSASASGYAGTFDNSAVGKRELLAQKRLGAGGGYHGNVSLRFNDAAPTDVPAQGSVTVNESPAVGQAFGWRHLAAGAHEPVFGLVQLKAAGSGLTVAATDRLLGRASAGAGPVEEIACSAAGRALLGSADAAAQRGALGIRRGFSFHCAGTPAGGEVIGGGIAPSAMVIVAAGSKCRALAAATGATTLAIRRNGSEVGTISFAAASIEGVIAVTDGTLTAGDQLTIHHAAAGDATLADIDGLLSE